ncbi:MAG: chloride channel protein [Deltaproteobacteria bacterium]|nr:chloride channel protein [Deltaproteobacteria bacterium]MBN2671565.1 chloride channel protein [Deltaproteobacteria bacterium]
MKGQFKLISGWDNRIRLILIAVVVGVVSGMAAVLLNAGLHWFSHLTHHPRHPWLLPVFSTVGIVLSVVLFRFVFRDSGGHGVPEVIHSISKKGGELRLRTAPSRLVCCILTIAGGGSAGPEAPLVISGASIGSNLADLFKMKERQRVVLVGCGASAAIASIFNAPVTGILFTMEAVVGEWSKGQLIPIAIAAVVGTEVSHLFRGKEIVFTHRTFHFSHTDVLATIFLALLTAVVAVLFFRLFRVISRQMETRLPSFWIRAVLGGLAVGGVAILFPDVAGEGYDAISRILNSAYTAPIYLLATVLFIKMAASAVTSGAGGVGGIFAPSLVVGAMTGLLFSRVAGALFPHSGLSEDGFFALLGMAGVISSILQAPLTGIFLILEITASYNVLLPVVLVSVLSVTLSSFFEPDSIYHKELFIKGLMLRHRTDARVLTEIQLTELIEKDCISIHPTMTLGEFVKLTQQSVRNFFPVLSDANGKYMGMVTLNAAKPYMFEPLLYETVLVENFMTTDLPEISPFQELADVIQQMDRTDTFSLPVVDNGTFIGLISKGTLLDHYRKEMIAQEED